MSGLASCRLSKAGWTAAKKLFQASCRRNQKAWSLKVKIKKSSKGYRGISQICRKCSCHAMPHCARVMSLRGEVLEVVNTRDVDIALFLFGNSFGDLI